MILGRLGRVEDADKNLSPPGPMPVPRRSRLAGEGDMVELSPRNAGRIA